MFEWLNTTDIPSENFTCGYCGKNITSNLGYRMYNSFVYGEADPKYAYIYICHECNKPTYICFEEQVPGTPYGKKFDKNIFSNDLVYNLYEEARKCMSINAYTSVGMCCRKLLMHISVDCGAKEGENFSYYVEFLDKNNYIPAKCKKWVDIIRSKGNEANHEIIILEGLDAKQLLQFMEIMISVIYEMPYEANQYIDKNN